jgi:hypothetical protein
MDPRDSGGGRVGNGCALVRGDSVMVLNQLQSEDRAAVALREWLRITQVFGRIRYRTFSAAEPPNRTEVF